MQAFALCSFCHGRGCLACANAMADAAQGNPRTFRDLLLARAEIARIRNDLKKEDI